MAKAVMIQGTMSNAGKSLLAAGLCRIFAQDGLRVAPFKSQNMALNSHITRDGLEMGRAQAVQAEACGIEPDVRMNPILLKPTSDMGSQVILNGEVQGNMRAMDYFRKKKEYIPAIRRAYEQLAAEYDVIVIEGAGSPAEINLKQDDIVNMGMAEIADAPVLLVGDIDRGGVFAQLIGTVILLEEKEQERIKGLIINKFRGDRQILEPGLAMLTEKCQKKVLGVIPWMDVDIEEEDSLAESLGRKVRTAETDIAVIRFPRISNFTDFQAFDLEEDVSVRYVNRVEELGNPDAILLPGTKSTLSDLRWLRACGLEAAVLRKAGEGTLVFGICGGYQMLGTSLVDEEGVEGGGRMRGMGLLPVKTCFAAEKTRTRAEGKTCRFEGELAGLSEKKVCGYEIHMGRSIPDTDSAAETVGFARLKDKQDGCCAGGVLGTYLHGVFDEEEFRTAFVEELYRRKGIARQRGPQLSYREYKEKQYDRLADILRKNLDMEEIYRIVGVQRIDK